MTIHIFNTPEAFQSYHHLSDSIDLLLLIEDAVYLCLSQDLTTDPRIKILVDDVRLRSISLSPTLSYISYAEWVSLTDLHQNSVSWGRP